MIQGQDTDFRTTDGHGFCNCEARRSVWAKVKLHSAGVGGGCGICYTYTMRGKSNIARLLAAWLCASLMAAQGADLEGEFLEPVSVTAKPVLELSLPLAGMDFDRAVWQIDRAREMGAGGVLLEVGTADEKVWELLAKLTDHAGQTGMEIGLRDFFVAPDEAVSMARLRRLSWAAYPVQGPAELGTNAFPSVFREDALLRLLECMAVPHDNGGARLPQPVNMSKGGHIGEGRWSLIRFGTIEIDPPMPDYFVDKRLARHVNRWLSECQSRLSRGYGRTVQWYQMSMPGRHELIWMGGLPTEFLKLSGLGLERHLPALAGFTVGGEAVTEHVRRHLAGAVRSLWRERIGKTVEELVFAAGLDAGLSIGETTLDPEEVSLYFRRPMIDVSRCEASARANRRASGGARAMGRRLVTGRLVMAAGTNTPVAAILPFPWKREVDRLLTDGATRILLDTGGAVPNDAGLGGLRELCLYLHRCQTLLQKGEPVSDMLVLGDAPPAALAGHMCDCANGVMLDAAFFEDGRVGFESERSYRHVAVTAESLRQSDAEKLVRRLASNGVVVWLVPTGASEEEQVFGRLSQGHGDGAIRRFREGSGGLPAADFVWRSDEADMRLRFLHRQTGEREIYFVVNDSEVAGPVECVFRDTGKGVPARWDPVKGEVGLLAGNAARLPDGSVRASFFMEPYDACFIVFER